MTFDGGVSNSLKALAMTSKENCVFPLPDDPTRHHLKGHLMLTSTSSNVITVLISQNMHQLYMLT